VADREPGYRVRPARPEDLPGMLERWHELNRFQAPWRVFPPRASLAEEVEAIYRHALEAEDSAMFVAVAGGEVLGTALGHPVVPSSFSDEPAMELSSVVVAPSHRGRGIGRALALAVAGFARDRGVRLLTLKTFAHNESALEFWRGIGFQPRMVQMVAPPDTLLDVGEAAPEHSPDGIEDP